MANECSVWEMQAPRGSSPLRTVPWLARTLTGSTGAVVTFNASTQMISVKSSIAGNLYFSTLATTTPTTGVTPFPIAADTFYDFDVRPKTAVLFSTV